MSSQKLSASNNRPSASTPYDGNALYQTQIAPLVAPLQEQCLRCNLPFFFACATKNSSVQTQYQYSCISPKVFQMKLANNTFDGFLGVMCGIELTMPRTLTSEQSLQQSVGLPDESHKGRIILLLLPHMMAMLYTKPKLLHWWLRYRNSVYYAICPFSLLVPRKILKPKRSISTVMPFRKFFGYNWLTMRLTDF
jgi:hypothetical protein